MVGHASAFLSLIAGALPDMLEAFGPIRRRLGSAAEADAARAVYAGLSETNFSHHVLAVSAGRLAVLPVIGVRWSDWGEPDRVLGTLARIGVRPAWSEAPIAVPA